MCSRNVTVAIVDTGVDITHPELKSKLSTNVYESVDGRDNDGNVSDIVIAKCVLENVG
ncbi:MAG: hypothetical protein EBU01_12405, partial [Crocinitomicaceae bacterium]|nr:hypothetical protein [Crocinitomicaceae bacterium]